MPTTQPPTRFGYLHLPFHRMDVNPTLQLERDLQLVELADSLGFDEMFCGEHHSAGHEIVGTPEMFLAAAAQRTRRIRLGSGVVSVPYHNPFHIAERAVLLDHLSQGRHILGVGPGSLTSDAKMFGLEVADSRRKLGEGLDVIVRLLEGEVVTEETDWFKLEGARLQLNSYQLPRVEMVTACVASPTGPRAAGKYGLGMINMSALSSVAFEALRDHWSVVEYEAEQAGRSCDRSSWRLCGLLHIAESEKQARKDLSYGFREVMRYLEKASILPPLEGDTFDQLLDNAIEQDVIVIGTPETAINVVEELAERTGGFGVFCISLMDYVDYAAQRRCLELFAEQVIPHFRGQLGRRESSAEWALGELGGGRQDWEKAIAAATESYKKERAEPSDRSSR